MTTTNIDFHQEYEQAEAAYMTQNYDEAAARVYTLVEQFPDDPSARLLCGHIYCYGLHQYDIALQQYGAVLHLTDDPDLLDHANTGLSYASQFLSQDMGGDVSLMELPTDDYDHSRDSVLEIIESNEESNSNLDHVSWSNPLSGTTELDDPELEEDYLGNILELEEDLEYYNEDASNSPFAPPPNSDPGGTGRGGFSLETHSVLPTQSDDEFNDPFVLDEIELDPDAHNDPEFLSIDMDMAATELIEPNANVSDVESLEDLQSAFEFSDSSAGINSAGLFAPIELPEYLELEEEPHTTPSLRGGGGQRGAGNGKVSASMANPVQYERGVDSEEETLLMGGARRDPQRRLLSQNPSNQEPIRGYDSAPPLNSESRADRATPLLDDFNIPETFDIDAFDDDEILENDFSFDQKSTQSPQTRSSASAPRLSLPTGSKGHSPSEEVGFLDEFDEFDEFGSIPDFDLDDSTGSSLMNGVGIKNAGGGTSSNFDFGEDRDRSAIGDSEMFGISSTSVEPGAVFTSFSIDNDEQVDTTVTIEQGGFAFWENAPLRTKQLYTAVSTGLAALVSVAIVVNVTGNQSLQQNKPELIGEMRRTGWIMTLAGGATSFLTSWGLGTLVSKQIKKSTDDLQSQFEAISLGKLESRATVYSEDEFGKMASKFNLMAKIMLTTTKEAQNKAMEMEQEKEDLQREVIRLLDDVEGAARGDLTVEAKVTANVLGAVADSFNLTIQNLRGIVIKVQKAAQEVNRGSADSAKFAQGLSSDALRQAEEIVAALNSVQVLTDAIQRVAESAKEAEEVARGAAATANRGGEAVELTVAGILEIRENVSETARKVKRLAEASQEISKIVALIATIASRTNLLALNASIEAARAGDAGRGFAIVADEVRQLADRSAKSLKEIEQIVMLIQSETGAVMTAMEEGTQQVIKGTKLAEQAKRSLEDIIQVTNRIDVLVRSITTDTIEQNEVARTVAEVMRGVEKTAQETSHESQRVYVSLNNLVGVARDLLASAERFRVETTDPQR
jgi:twitching motility protein PilJ